MSTPTHPHAGPHLPLGEIIGDAIGFWERWRIGYNLALATLVVILLASAWTHVRVLLGPGLLLALFILAVLANVCYCAAYLVDVPVQLSAFRDTWRRRRWLLWLVGTLFGMTLAWYWIVDEILPASGA